jgi:hypothetical protein
MAAAFLAAIGKGVTAFSWRFFGGARRSWFVAAPDLVNQIRTSAITRSAHPISGKV